MSHEITIREDGRAEFFSAVTAGWHKIGQTSERKLTWAEAMKEALLDFTVEAAPLFHQTLDGQLLPIEGKKAIRRTDNNKVLGVMSDSYAFIQNQEAGDFLDSIIGAGQAVYDTAGSLQGGRKIFMQVELPGKMFLNSRPDDEVMKKILLFNSHDGSKALTCLITPIRVVCMNTLNAALGNCSNVFKVYHRKNFQSKKDEAAKVLGLANAYYDDLQTVMDTLASQKVNVNYVENFVDTLMPSKKEDEEETSTRTQNRREQIVNLFESGRGNRGESKWDLYNAVTEYVDHHQGTRVSKNRTNRSDEFANVDSELRFERALLGSGAVLKQKAMDLLLAN